MNDTTVGYRPQADAPADTSLEGILAEQVNDWMRGERSPLKVYLDRLPALCDREDALVELIHQEVVLRRDARGDSAARGLQRRLPRALRFARQTLRSS